MHGMACMFSPYVDSIDRSITPMISGMYSTGARHVTYHRASTPPPTQKKTHYATFPLPIPSLPFPFFPPSLPFFSPLRSRTSSNPVRGVRALEGRCELPSGGAPAEIEFGVF